MKKNGNAFNLIELMLVVTIIAFLATLAIPRYSNYFTRAYQAEVATMLASLHTAQQVHKATHGSYSTILYGKDSIGWKPEGQFYYTYGFNVPGAQEGIHYFMGKLGTPIHSLGITFADEKGFLVKAGGIVNQQEKPDVWQMNEKRELKQI